MCRHREFSTRQSTCALLGAFREFHEKAAAVLAQVPPQEQLEAEVRQMAEEKARADQARREFRRQMEKQLFEDTQARTRAD